jgi:uncharacterized protein YbcV (DUF1398 family)
MNAHAKAVLEECTLGSDQGSLTFPEVVHKLGEIDVEQYHADLRRSEKTYYLIGGESEVVACHAVAGSPAQTFAPRDVETAIRASQAGSIDYRAFCERIVAAGCVGYFVCLHGRRAVYFGRSGESYVEPFPPAG